MEELFNTFSCKSWILLKEDHAHKLVQMLSLQKRRDDLSWEQLLEGQDKTPNTIIFTSAAKGYVIVEGDMLEQKGTSIAELLSADDLVFNMTIDIWVPYMYIEIFDQGKLIRRLEYNLDVEADSVVAIESGDKSSWEKEINYTPESTLGYDDFFYPLYFINSLGIGMAELKQLYNSKCTSYDCASNL